MQNNQIICSDVSKFICNYCPVKIVGRFSLASTLHQKDLTSIFKQRILNVSRKQFSGWKNENTIKIIEEYSSTIKAVRLQVFPNSSESLENAQKRFTHEIVALTHAKKLEQLSCMGKLPTICSPDNRDYLPYILKDFAELRHLSITLPLSLTHNWSVLSQLQNLESLSLGSVNTSEEIAVPLLSFIDTFKCLKSLKLFRTFPSQFSLLNSLSLTNLRSLSFEGKYGDGIYGSSWPIFESISKFTTLTSLSWTVPEQQSPSKSVKLSLSVNFFDPLLALSHLQSYSSDNINLCETIFLSRMTQLRHLQLIRINQIYIEQLLSLPNLSCLEIDQADKVVSTTDRSLLGMVSQDKNKKWPNELSYLNNLKIGDPILNDQLLLKLFNHPNLQFVNLNQVTHEFSDQSKKHLLESKTLKKLVINSVREL